MRGPEPRLSKYLTVKYIIIIITEKIKHQLFTSDVEVESWLKFLNKEGLQSYLQSKLLGWFLHR